VKIAILMEGETEGVFLACLRGFLGPRLPGNMPKLIPDIYYGRIPKQEKLKSRVEHLLGSGNPHVDHVIALTDVYTGTKDFNDAADAKQKMRNWVGPDKRFHPHAAQHDFEAWLLPYWSAIQKLARHNGTAPSGRPESIDHIHPPSYHIKEIFRRGKVRDYIKTRDAIAILQGKDLSVAAVACPELRAFLNTILTLSDGDPI